MSGATGMSLGASEVGGRQVVFDVKGGCAWLLCILFHSE